MAKVLGLRNPQLYDAQPYTVKKVNDFPGMSLIKLSARQE
jgi:hypothetical protein